MSAPTLIHPLSTISRSRRPRRNSKYPTITVGLENRLNKTLGEDATKLLMWLDKKFHYKKSQTTPPYTIHEYTIQQNVQSSYDLMRTYMFNDLTTISQLAKPHYRTFRLDLMITLDDNLLTTYCFKVQAQ